MTPGRRLALALGLGGAAVAVAMALSLLLGPQRVSASAALAGLEPDRAILLGLRLPRALLGALVGAALGAAGVALQALLRNPLADPFVLGVSGGAALGGSFALAAAGALGPATVLGGLAAASSSVAIAAAAGAAAATALVFALGRIGGRLVPEAALLVGVVFNAFAAGVITLLKVMMPPEQAARMLYWLTGAFGYATPGALLAGGALVAASLAALVALSGQLNLLSLGDEEAASLGVEVGRSRGAVFLASSAATGAAVALAGMVGFVGLVVPHFLRRAFGPDHRLLVPASALFGAAFLLLADLLARLAFVPFGSEPPVGALTALAGGPFFLWLLRRTERTG
ncbi:MAG TPA: iron ABC transporter permease [Anaeromyxobacteraceae bacterium]|nr:iron ABC transporter permease [Anaeromyxobacteraceae bacterium]